MSRMVLVVFDTLPLGAEFFILKMERGWQKGYVNHSESLSDAANYIVGFHN